MPNPAIPSKRYNYGYKRASVLQGQSTDRYLCETKRLGFDATDDLFEAMVSNYCVLDNPVVTKLVTLWYKDSIIKDDDPNHLKFVGEMAALVMYYYGKFQDFYGVTRSKPENQNIKTVLQFSSVLGYMARELSSLLTCIYYAREMPMYRFVDMMNTHGIRRINPELRGKKTDASN
jgi:hypothetical protein